MNQRKVTKYRKPFHINTGVIVFGIIFIYIVTNALIFFTKEQLSVYAVDKKYKISDDTIFNGVVIREENIMYTSTSGYISYFFREGERVAKKARIYTIDETGKLYDAVTAKESEDNLFPKESMIQIKQEIASFYSSFSNARFDKVYDFKYAMENAVLELANYNLINNLDEALKVLGNDNTFKSVESSVSGIISYTMDSMEKLTVDDVNEATFKNSEYMRTQLRSSNLIEIGAPVYKMVTNENWSIVLLINKETYDKLQEKTTTRIKFLKDGLKASADIETYEKEGSYFARLDLKTGMIRYLNERFLEVEIILNMTEGLKIPHSSIIEKTFYKIPLEYFTEGGNSKSFGVSREVYNENGEKSFLFIPTEIYYQDDEYGYIDTSVLNIGDSISKVDSTDKFTIGLTGNLIGVFNVNKGYAIFKRIEKLYENDEYCIIKDNTEYGLSLFDHIILNAQLAVEQAIIY